MDSGLAFIEDLKDDYARLGQLLAVIDDGRWWTAEKPGRREVKELSTQASLIRSATNEIELVVGRLGS